MRKIILDGSVKMIGVKNFKGKDKLVDYFIDVPGKERIYAFSRTFTQNAYDMCKSGIRVNELAAKRSRDTGIMSLVNYYNLMAPYLAEEYELRMA